MKKPGCRKLNTFWEELAKEGDFNMYQTEHRDKAIDLLKEYKVKSVLDIGCGSGPNYKMILDQGIDIKYKGTDVTHRWVDYCKKQWPDAEWEIQDVREIPEEDNSWDCLLLVHIIDHIKEHEKAIKELHRVTSRLVILDIWRPFTTTSDTRIQSRNEWGGKWEDTWLVTYNQKQLEDIFNKVGFEIIYTKNFPKCVKDHHSFVYVLRKI